MSSSPVVKPSLAALALRLTLAAILIASGLEKIAVRDTDWGARWASVLWEQHSDVPRTTHLAMLEMLRAREAESEERKAVLAFRNELKSRHASVAGAMPAALGYHAVQFAVAWGELLGGVALLLGVMTRLAALGILIIQVGAVVTVTWAYGFSFSQGGGWGYNLAILGMCLALMCLGSGALSLSAVLKRKKKAQAVPQEQQMATPLAV
jgi:uncharacterized membrane protein YphA (DoxX/SURF4 family)